MLDLHVETHNICNSSSNLGSPPSVCCLSLHNYSMGFITVQVKILYSITLSLTHQNSIPTKSIGNRFHHSLVQKLLHCNTTPEVQLFVVGLIPNLAVLTVLCFFKSSRNFRYNSQNRNRISVTLLSSLKSRYLIIK